MALTGNLESFPLAEVLRLAARSRQSGLLRVECAGTQGQLFFADGHLTNGTTRDHDDLGGDLTKIGLIDPHKWYPVERGEAPIESAIADGRDPSELRIQITERITDVLIRLMRSKHGTFDFADDVKPLYLSDVRVDVEQCLGAAEERVAEWQSIEALIPSTSHRMVLSGNIGDAPSVKLPAPTWRIVAAMTARTTVEDVADRTGITDFQAAKAMAELVKVGLLEVAPEDHAGPSPTVGAVAQVTGTLTPFGAPSAEDMDVAAHQHVSNGI